MVFPGSRMEKEEWVGGKAGYRKLGGGGNIGGSWEYGNCAGSKESVAKKRRLNLE
jgi:hypothetical protein